MGRMIYAREFVFEIDDRPLFHLRIVLMTKLRRSEPFMLDLPDSVGMRSIWIAPAVSMTLAFSGGRAPVIDLRWVDEMMADASSSRGLSLVGVTR
jgi:hypothetical protein